MTGFQSASSSAPWHLQFAQGATCEGGELGVHPALLQATSARLEGHDFAHPRLAITQLGVKAELNGAMRLALNATETTLSLLDA